MARRLALILGSSGQLARALQSCESGFEATALGRPVLDLTDPRSVRAAIAKTAPALVINAAAYTAVDKAEEEPDAAFAVNETGAAGGRGGAGPVSRGGRRGCELVRGGRGDCGRGAPPGP